MNHKYVFVNIVTMTTKILQKIGQKQKICFQHTIFMLKNWPSMKLVI